MSRSSSSHTTHDASESGHTASLFRQPIQDSEEDPLEDEVNSIHSPTPTPTSVPSPPTRQEVSPHPSLPSTYHVGEPSSTDPYVTARASDRYSWEHLMDHPRHPQDPDQILAGSRLQNWVECQAELLLEISDIVRRLTHQITRAICTAEGAIVIGRRAWYLGLLAVILVLALVLMVALINMSGLRNTHSTNTSTTNEDQPNDLEGMVARQLNAALPNLVMDKRHGV
ncbi:hypothetical protein Tco_0878255 [Tanacetum coccineum]|uniref:Uncharacterized protein n=1 Tax=Tanacetum coccineum TaxID=301880 RepID=A0ABQ5BZ85_9ASTR